MGSMRRAPCLWLRCAYAPDLATGAGGSPSGARAAASAASGGRKTGGDDRAVCARQLVSRNQCPTGSLRFGHVQRDGDGRATLFPAEALATLLELSISRKGLAVAAGLGSIGRNGLLIAEASHWGCEGAQSSGAERGARENGLLNDGAANETEASPVTTSTTATTTAIATAATTAKAPFPYASSAVLLGLMFLPFDIEEALIPPRRPPRTALLFCGNCRRCVEACPTGALHVAQQPVFERERCIQYYSSRLEPLPAFIEASWQDQLYGCDLCLNACPYFRPDPEAHTDRGAIGGALDAESIAHMNDGQLRALLKGTSLDQKWIAPGALRRNATLALRKRGGSQEAQ